MWKTDTHSVTLQFGQLYFCIGRLKIFSFSDFTISDFVVSAFSIIIWTVLIRVFPSILSTTIQKRIEYQYDEKLERTKAELQASYSNLRTSVEFLSSTQSELRSKMIKAVEKLWETILAVKKEFGLIILIDKFWFPDHADKAFNTDEADNPIMEEAKLYKNPHLPMDKLEKANALNTGMERLFVGERLWLIYNTVISVHSRFGYLIHESLDQRKYVSWQDDKSFVSLFEPILPKEVINKAQGKKIGGLSMLITHLEAEFFKEATRVMSGSQGLVDSLSDINSTLKYETLKEKSPFNREKPQI